MAGWDDGIFGNLPPRYSQPATPGAQPPVLTDDGSAWPQAQPAAPTAAQGQDSGYWWPKLLQGLWNTAKSGATLPGDVATGRASMADPATQGRVGDLATLATLGAGAVPAEPDALNMGIRAYHGSPYSFDRFDISKIGEGEGAQAYGHGLYFASNEDVAKSYRDSLSGGQWTYDGKLARESWPTSALEWLDRKVVNEQGMPAAFNEAIGRLQNSSKFYNDTYGGSGSNLYDYAIARLQKMDPSKVKPAGSMYQVDINADPGQFLDWDRPLSEQPSAAQPILQEAVKNEAYNRALAATSKRRADELWGMVKDPTTAPAGFAQELLKKPEVAQQLQQAGVPGIKYLDQGSRGAGGEGGTQNYVTFSDDIINILKKYGLTGLGLTAGAGALATQHPSAAQAAPGMTLGGGR